MQAKTRRHHRKLGVQSEYKHFPRFCQRNNKNYPEEFPRIIGSNNATDIDPIKITEEIINSIKLQKSKPYGDSFYYMRPILSEIKNLKRENISP